MLLGASACEGERDLWEVGVCRSVLRNLLEGLGVRSAGERIWHTHDNQGQILALASRSKSFKPFKFSLFARHRFYLT